MLDTRNSLLDLSAPFNKDEDRKQGARICHLLEEDCCLKKNLLVQILTAAGLQIGGGDTRDTGISGTAGDHLVRMSGVGGWPEGREKVLLSVRKRACRPTPMVRFVEPSSATGLEFLFEEELTPTLEGEQIQHFVFLLQIADSNYDKILTIARISHVKRDLNIRIRSVCDDLNHRTLLLNQKLRDLKAEWKDFITLPGTLTWKIREAAFSLIEKEQGDLLSAIDLAKDKIATAKEQLSQRRNEILAELRAQIEKNLAEHRGKQRLGELRERIEKNVAEAKGKARNEVKKKAEIERQKELVRRHFAGFSQTEEFEVRRKLFAALGKRKSDAFERLGAEVAQEAREEAEHQEVPEVSKESKGRRIRELRAEIERGAVTEIKDQRITKKIAVNLAELQELVQIAKALSKVRVEGAQEEEGEVREIAQGSRGE